MAFPASFSWFTCFQCRWLHSNRGSLVSEATARPPELQPFLNTYVMPSSANKLMAGHIDDKGFKIFFMFCFSLAFGQILFDCNRQQSENHWMANSHLIDFWGRGKFCSKAQWIHLRLSSAVPGLSPKHTIYTFIIYSETCAIFVFALWKEQKQTKRGGVGPFLKI